jgi:hypothetical protein
MNLITAKKPLVSISYYEGGFENEKLIKMFFLFFASSGPLAKFSQNNLHFTDEI